MLSPPWKISSFGATALALFVFTPADAAEQFCYAYDEIGQLVAVVDPQGQTAIYDYDPVGNILAVRRNDATTAVAITFVTPATAVAGQQIQIIGIGFSPTPSENQVTINGVAATVVSSISCELTVIVPAGATAGSSTITVTTPTGTATSPGPTIEVGVFVVPPQAAAVINHAIGFSVTVTGTADNRVTWAVNGVLGGSATVGMIDPTGAYTAPMVVPATPVTVRATSVAAPGAFGEATVTIVQQGGPVYAAPVSLSFAPPPIGNINVEPVPVSISFALPPLATAYAPPVSVADGPVINSIAPNMASPGTTFTLTLNGANFTGATGLVFVLNGQLDSGISAANIAVSTSGNQLTAQVTIGAAAAVGVRVVVVQTPVGSSNPEDTGNNTLTLTMP